MIFATTSTRPGMGRSFVKMTRRSAGRAAIQSRVSAPPTGSLQFQSLKMGHGSQTQTQQSAGGNDPSARDQMGVDYELATVLTSQVARKNLCKKMQTSSQRHNRCIWTSSTEHFPQNGSLQCTIGTESAQHRKTNTAK